MKSLLQKNIILFSFLLLISINNTIQSDIHYIADASMNATAAFVMLEGLEKNDYVYFSFDLAYHNEHFPKQNDVVYFEISTEMKLSFSDFNHAFLNKEWTGLAKEDFGESITWKNSFLIATKKNGNDYYYYIQVNKFGGKNKLNTLVLRIPVLSNEGFLAISNIKELPENILDNDI